MAASSSILAFIYLGGDGGVSAGVVECASLEALAPGSVNLLVPVEQVY